MNVGTLNWQEKGRRQLLVINTFVDGALHGRNENWLSSFVDSDFYTNDFSINYLKDKKTISGKVEMFDTVVCIFCWAASIHSPFLLIKVYSSFYWDFVTSPCSPYISKETGCFFSHRSKASLAKNNLPHLFLCSE